MSFRMRLFLDSVIDLVNDFDDIPIEARRLVLESVIRLVEKKADEEIVREREQLLNNSADIESEENDAKDILENKLGELSE